jgi:hypothetical protein
VNVGERESRAGFEQMSSTGRSSCRALGGFEFSLAYSRELEKPTGRYSILQSG